MDNVLSSEKVTLFMKCQMSVPERPENGTYMSNNEGSDKRMVVVERVRVESSSLMVCHCR